MYAYCTCTVCMNSHRYTHTNSREKKFTVHNSFSNPHTLKNKLPPVWSVRLSLGTTDLKVICRSFILLIFW